MKGRSEDFRVHQGDQINLHNGQRRWRPSTYRNTTIKSFPRSTLHN